MSVYDMNVPIGTLKNQVEKLPPKQVQIPGPSAYEDALAEGFHGSRRDWLKSLRGPEGKSAYEVAVDNGFDGTEEEWIDFVSHVESEAQRQANETQRVEAEAKREALFEEWKAVVDLKQIQINQANISKNDKRITNLEQGLPDDNFMVDDTVAYTKDVPTNALPFAEIAKIGGMTYKDGDTLRSAKVTEVESVGANFFKPIYFNQFVANGCTISHIEDGFKVIVNADDPFWSYIDERFGLKEGDYYFYCQVNDGAYAVVQNPYGEIVKNGDPISIRTGRGWHFELEGYSIGKTYDAKIAFTKIPVSQFPYYTCNAIPIPEAVRNLDGYGWGVSENCYNYIDWEKKQFVKRVEKIVLDGSETILDFKASSHRVQYNTEIWGKAANNGLAVLCADYTTATNNALDSISIYQENYVRILIFDKNIGDTINTQIEWSAYLAERYAAGNPLTIYYELATPEVTDISDLITADNLIAVEGNGTLTFVNEYGYAVPSTIEYQLEV